MPAEAKDINELLADAKLVVAYCARTGRPQISDLLDAVYKVEPQLNAGNTVQTPDVQALYSSLNAAISGIRPVTLIDLGSKWRPFGEQIHSRSVRIVLAIFAASIIILTSYYTNLYIEETDVIGGLTSIQEKEPLDKAERLFNLYKKNPSSETLYDIHSKQDEYYNESYIRLYEELSPIDDQLSTYVQTANSLNQQIGRMPGWDFIEKTFGVSSGQHASDTQQATFTIQHPKSAYPQLVADPADGAAPATLVKAPDSMAKPNAPAPSGAGDGMLQRNNNLSTFLTNEGLPDVATEVSQGVLVNQTHIQWLLSTCRETVELFGVFILPSLYGMIGTLVFELRRILNPLSPNAPVERIIVRAALGALAGLSITFVFRPFHPASDDASFSGIAVFGIAFLLGFSIDVFFSALDRLVNVVSQTISGPARP